MRQNKIFQCENGDIYKMHIYFPHLFITYCPHKSVKFYFINLIFGEVAQHQSQCSIFANQQLKVSNIFLCSCCFKPIATWLSFRCWPTLINPFTDCFHWAKLPTLFRKFYNNCSVSKTKFPQCLDQSFIFALYFTHNQSYRPITAINV